MDLPMAADRNPQKFNWGKKDNESFENFNWNTFMNYFDDSASLSAFKHLCNMCRANVVMLLLSTEEQATGLEVFSVGFFLFLVFGVIQIRTKQMLLNVIS